ncbi:MAG: transcriptional repressor LexA [Deltaproteobacteria bacterium]|nr:transcriptional repressor LexA [Deltaproteobacteria bacterium]
MKIPYLTPRQRSIVRFIQEYSDLHGRAPTQREIAEHLGLSSLGTVQSHIMTLSRKGILLKEWNQNRSLRLVHPFPLEPGGAVELRLAGQVAAGKPIEAILDYETVKVPEELLGRGENFALRVKGDSMIGDGICDGDVIIVRRSEDAENGQTVVALIDEHEATVKRFRRNGDGTVTLSPTNPAYEEMVCEESRVAIQGIVVGLLRKYP